MQQAIPLSRIPLRELRRRILAGELKPTALTDYCIQQRLRYDRVWNAFHQVDDDAMRAAAVLAEQSLSSQSAGALCGLPVSIKAVICVDGYKCYAGAPDPFPAKWEKQGAVVEHILAAGAVMSGITHSAELAVGGLGVNPHWGTPCNPWDIENHRVPGGSSAGAASSVWQGACVAALGTDTGGSVRVPASVGGLVGFKVSADRWPISGVVPLASRFDTIGILAHTVDDVRVMFECIDQLSSQSSGSVDELEKLGVADFRFKRASGKCWQELDPGIEQVIEDALSELSQAGATVDADDGGLCAEAAALRDKGPNTAAIECNALLDNEFPELKARLSLHVTEFLRSSDNIPRSAYEDRLQRIMHWRNSIKSRLDPTDIIVSPTVRCTPPTMQQLEDRDEFIKYSDGMLHNTVLPSINGYCAITLPVGLDAAGMPVGLQLSASAGSECILLHVASCVEKTLGTGIDRFGLPPLLDEYDPSD